MAWDVDDSDETEFGLGPGIIDPTNRANRVLDSYQEAMEIRALPHSFDKSMPDRLPPDKTPVPRLQPGETEADRG